MKEAGMEYDYPEGTEPEMRCHEDDEEDINSLNEVLRKRCYTVEELQLILGVSRPTVYNLIRQKQFRAFQIAGGRWRISRKSFDKWLDTMC